VLLAFFTVSCLYCLDEPFSFQNLASERRKLEIGRNSMHFDVTSISWALNHSHCLLLQKESIPASLQSGSVYSSNSVLSRKMGFDCGFDIYPALEPTPSNKEKYELFLHEVLRTYEVGDEAEGRDSVVRVVPRSNGAYIDFMVGEHPTIPNSCEYFLRFSSKVSGMGTVAAKPYIEGVYRIAKTWLGDRVHFWHEMNETGDHRQRGYYNWNEVYAVRRRMKEQEGKTKHENEGMDEAADTSTVNETLYAIMPIPGKGQGLIATSKILKGTRILSEPQSSRSQDMQPILRPWKALSLRN